MVFIQAGQSYIFFSKNIRIDALLAPTIYSRSTLAAGKAKAKPKTKPLRLEHTGEAFGGFAVCLHQRGGGKGYIFQNTNKDKDVEKGSFEFFS